MAFDYDLITIGLGPAGMAVSIMGAEMGLKVCGIEKHKIGGECMNVGCIPSKSLLRMAKARHVFEKLDKMELSGSSLPDVGKPFERIAGYLKYINDNKTTNMFKKVDLILGEGAAEFVDAHTVLVGERKVSAKRIYIAAGTRPRVPPIKGIEQIDILTNENIFALEKMPESMVVIGGGAIGCEMAQAFNRLGCKTSIVHMDDHLVAGADKEAGELLEKVLTDEGIEICNGCRIESIEKSDDGVVVHTDTDRSFKGERLLVAAGRQPAFEGLKLDNAGIRLAQNGFIEVNKYLQTNQKNIYAVGDCNGYHMFSHAAMHQGMIAIMNSMMFGPMRRDFRKYVVPWTVFTDPQVSFVGQNEKELQKKGVKYEVITMNYEDYGAAIAEAVDVGFVRALVSKTGRIYGVTIVGEGSGEMINEWALAIQKKLRMHDIMFLQHSFPTMGFLTKRASEQWMMNRMAWEPMKAMCKLMF